MIGSNWRTSKGFLACLGWPPKSFIAQANLLSLEPGKTGLEPLWEHLFFPFGLMTGIPRIASLRVFRISALQPLPEIRSLELLQQLKMDHKMTARMVECSLASPFSLSQNVWPQPASLKFLPFPPRWLSPFCFLKTTRVRWSFSPYPSPVFSLVFWRTNGRWDL